MNPEELGELIYNDPFVFAILPNKPAAKGHIRIYPKTPAKSLDELKHEEVQHLFMLGNIAASTLFDEVGAHGTNLILNEGNMFNEQIFLDIVARTENDGLDLKWEPKEIPANDMDEAQKRIKDRTDLIGSEAPEEIIQHEPLEEIKDDKNNYLIKQLDRLP